MLRLSFSHSIHLAVLLVAAHLLGIVSAWASDVPAWIKMLASLAVIASGTYHVRKHALLQAPDSVVEMLLKADGSVEITLRNGAAINGRQLSGSFIHPWFTAILWRAEGARFSEAVAVLPDSLPAAQFRELRVWLKWRRMEQRQ